MSKVTLTKDEVHSLRERLDVSQNDLAQMMNVVPECVSRWERGTGTCGGPAALLLKRLVDEHEHQNRNGGKNGHGPRRRSA